MRTTLLLVCLVLTVGAGASATHAETLAEAHFEAEAFLLGLCGLGLLWLTQPPR
jgi:hypothetical protein